MNLSALDVDCCIQRNTVTIKVAYDYDCISLLNKMFTGQHVLITIVFCMTGYHTSQWAVSLSAVPLQQLLYMYMCAYQSHIVMCFSEPHCKRSDGFWYPDITRNGISIQTQVCTQRLGSQKLHVSNILLLIIHSYIS